MDELIKGLAGPAGGAIVTGLLVLLALKLVARLRNGKSKSAIRMEGGELMLNESAIEWIDERARHKAANLVAPLQLSVGVLEEKMEKELARIRTDIETIYRLMGK